ncbi:site-specific integrase [Pseudomonas putida]|uniref:tyrosine-type recombinase/integrase n=1 Tax=Pseudomonas putida TaxID=303 RepID=UPI002363DDEA|nr:site-specific integrase [Pseudomonas putida]MDD2140239.1 site-specific integrase [Pseudomonas putida]HDS1726479.1 site-specific integrase [Pseudomonas putida]
MAISDTWLKANSGKPRAVREEKADREALSVRITPKGKITFQLRYRYDAKPCRLDLGTYPLMSLKEARTEAQRLRAHLEQGHDPRVVRQLERQVILQADSIESLFRQWYASYCKGNKKGHHEILRSFELHVFPKIGHLPAAQVTMHEWLALLEEQAKTRPGIADRILVNAKQMLKWGLKRQLIPRHPLSDINAKEDLQIKKVAGSRSLSQDEIRRVWNAIERSRMATKNKLFLKLCLIYGCRNGELRVSEKGHFDFRTMVWTVPATNHKLGKSSGKPLLRPITPETEVLIREAMELSNGSPYLFTNSGTSKPMGTGAPLQLPYNIMQWLRRHEKCEMAHWSVHDLRKTARTNFSTLTEPHIAEIMLGHKLPGSWQVYDQYDYLAEQRLAYSAWCSRLESLVH